MTAPLASLPPSPVEKELLRYFKKSDPLILFDIGSCDGTDAIRYSQMFPNAQVFAFEPIPENINRIRENIAKSGPLVITIVEAAMSDHSGTASMKVSSGSPDNSPNFIPQSSSLLAPDKHLELFPWCKFDETIEVKTDTIKEFCERHAIPAVDFIHLDVQGAELMVLKGAGSYLTKIPCIWLEVENVSLYKNQPLHKDIERFMKGFGFLTVKYRVGGFSGDQFYIHRDFIQSKMGNRSLLRYRLSSMWLLNPLVIFTKRIIRKVGFLFR